MADGENVSSDFRFGHLQTNDVDLREIIILSPELKGIISFGGDEDEEDWDTRLLSWICLFAIISKWGHIPKIDASHREVAPLIAENRRLLLDGAIFRNRHDMETPGDLNEQYQFSVLFSIFCVQLSKNYIEMEPFSTDCGWFQFNLTSKLLFYRIDCVAPKRKIYIFSVKFIRIIQTKIVTNNQICNTKSASSQFALFPNFIVTDVSLKSSFCKKLLVRH